MKINYGYKMFTQNAFETVYNTFSNNRKGFRDFINSIYEVYKSVIEHAKSMKKIYENTCIITQDG